MSLADAQRREVRAALRQLDLGPGDHVLEIGCGWGGFARHAADRARLPRHRPDDLARAGGARARADARPAGRDPRAGLPRRSRAASRRSSRSRCSRRSASDQFGTYFATIDRVLAPGGRAAVQTILVPEQRWDRYRRTPDWIERYVFPGCLIPSLEALTSAASRHSRLGVYGVDEIGEHYAETLRRWRASFHERIERGARARLRPPLRADVGLLPRLLRGGVPHAGAARRAAPPRPVGERGVNAYGFLNRVGFRELVRRLYRIEVVGGERIPPSGPAILVANHESIFDPFVLGVATRREIHYMAKAELFRSRPMAAALRSLERVSGRARRRRPGGDLGSGPPARPGRGARDVPAGDVEAGAAERLAPRRRAARARDRRAARPGPDDRHAAAAPGGRASRIDVGEPIAVPVGAPDVAAARALTEHVEQAVAAA